MTKEEAIAYACRIVAMAYRSIGDYSSPCDCFCMNSHIPDSHYQNTGDVLRYIRTAVVEKLKADGHRITKEILFPD